ncbi:integrase, partial [Micromonospora sp. KC606]
MARSTEKRKPCIISLMHEKQDESVARLIEEFLTARATRKPSPHTLEAYRRDLRTVAALVGEVSTPPLPQDQIMIAELSPRMMRAAFA